MNEIRLLGELEELRERIDILYRKADVCVYKFIRSAESSVQCEFEFVTNGGNGEYYVTQAGGEGEISLSIDGVITDSGDRVIAGVMRLAKGRHKVTTAYSGAAAGVIAVRISAPCLKEL